MRKWLVCVAVLVAALPCVAQTVSLTVEKSGSDVVLTWTGGVGPYTVLRSSHPTMTARTFTVTGTASPVTDVGGATRGVRIEYYQVSDSTAPTVTITSPPNGFASTKPCICAAGAASADALHVYVNTFEADGTTTWTSCPDTTGVPLAVRSDTRRGGGVYVCAAAVDADGNWTVATVAGTYTGVITDRVACRARTQGD